MVDVAGTIEVGQVGGQCDEEVMEYTVEHPVEHVGSVGSGDGHML